MRNIYDQISDVSLLFGKRLLYSLRDFKEQVQLSDEQTKFLYDVLDAVWAQCDYARHPEYEIQNNEEPV